jgi:hypothetical protein
MINDVELAGTRAPLVKSLDHHEPLQFYGPTWLALQSSNPGEELLGDIADSRGPDGTLDGDWRKQ